MIDSYKTVVNRFGLLVNSLEKFVGEIEIYKTAEDVVAFLDHLLVELIEMINIEKRFIINDSETNHDHRLDDHIKLLTQLVNIIEIDNIMDPSCQSSLVELLKELKSYGRLYGKSGQEDPILTSEYNEHFGCMIYVVCEYGLFIKLYGVTDDRLLLEMETSANIHKERLAYKDIGWGEIVDVRNWKLITQSSMDRAKSNTKKSTKNNKRFTYYITGESYINDYIAGQIIESAEHLTCSSKNFVEIMREMSKNDLKLGEIKAIDWVGNLSFINKN